MRRFERCCSPDATKASQALDWAVKKKTKKGLSEYKQTSLWTKATTLLVPVVMDAGLAAREAGRKHTHRRECCEKAIESEANAFKARSKEKAYPLKSITGTLASFYCLCGDKS